MKSKLLFVILIISAFLFVVGCGLQPGKNIFGKAGGNPECVAYCTEKFDSGELSRADRDDCLRRCAPVEETEEGFGGAQNKYCTDSEGKNFLEKGEVKIGSVFVNGEVIGETKEDFCYTFKNDKIPYLFEAVCAIDGNKVLGSDPFYYIQKKCEEGGVVAGLEPAGAFQCVEGKCVKKKCQPTYEVILAYVDADAAKFVINGETTSKLKLNEKYKLKDGSVITVTDHLYQNYAGGLHTAEMILAFDNGGKVSKIKYNFFEGETKSFCKETEFILIEKNDTFTLTPEFGKSYILQYLGADSALKPLPPKIKFKELGSGDTLEYSTSKSQYSDGSWAWGDPTIKLGGYLFMIYSEGDTHFDDYPLKVDLNGDGEFS